MVYVPDIVPIDIVVFVLRKKNCLSLKNILFCSNVIYRKTLFHKTKFGNVLLLTNIFYSNSFGLFIIKNSLKRIYLRISWI
jgi:hypothetical protein